jgi:hypothetical protein
VSLHTNRDSPFRGLRASSLSLNQDSQTHGFATSAVASAGAACTIKIRVYPYFWCAPLLRTVIFTIIIRSISRTANGAHVFLNPTPRARHHPCRLSFPHVEHVLTPDALCLCYLKPTPGRVQTGTISLQFSSRCVCACSKSTRLANPCKARRARMPSLLHHENRF